MNNIYLGYDHCVRDLIPEADIVQHRLDFELDFSMVDSQLRHALMFTRYSDVLYTNSINLAEVLSILESHEVSYFLGASPLLFEGLLRRGLKARLADQGPLAGHQRLCALP